VGVQCEADRETGSTVDMNGDSILLYQTNIVRGKSSTDSHKQPLGARLQFVEADHIDLGSSISLPGARRRQKGRRSR
jgi:hypothetical protein